MSGVIADHKVVKAAPRSDESSFSRMRRNQMSRHQRIHDLYAVFHRKGSIDGGVVAPRNLRDDLPPHF